jgi:hypothetical protein
MWRLEALGVRPTKSPVDSSRTAIRPLADPCRPFRICDPLAGLSVHAPAPGIAKRGTQPWHWYSREMHRFSVGGQAVRNQTTSVIPSRARECLGECSVRGLEAKHSRRPRCRLHFFEPRWGWASRARMNREANPWFRCCRSSVRPSLFRARWGLGLARPKHSTNYCSASFSSSTSISTSLVCHWRPLLSTYTPFLVHPAEAERLQRRQASARAHRARE